MATIHTVDLPRHKGELDLARQLSAFGDQGLHLWFSLDHVPGVRDIDVLIWHENAGVFVVEVKAVPLSQIQSFGYGRCEIAGRDADRGPQNQAYDAAISLRNYLSPRTTKLPFFVATACWPLISRAEWKRRFDHAKEIAELSERMLFAEDLFSDANTLLARLKYIWRNPPVRKGSDYEFRHDQDVLERLAAAVSPTAAPKPTLTDRARLDALERGIKKELLRDFPPGERRRAVFVGHPGTGKTFRLLQIGLAHAREGRRVLFACYNKVLAADIQRLVGLMDLATKSRYQGSSLKEALMVYDVFDLARRVAVQQRIDLQSEGYDEWGELITADLAENRSEYELTQYDTILIDEGQDMKNWHFDLLGLHARSESTMCVAVGTGQELYGNETTPCAWLREFIGKGARQIQLRRNFRNTRQVFQLANLFYECRLDATKIEETLRRFDSSTADRQASLSFDRPYGSVPALLNIADYNLPDYDSAFFPEEQEALMVGEYLRLFEGALKIVEAQDMPMDLLILVPSGANLEATWSRLALTQLEAMTEVGYLDYTIEKSRRDICPENKIRLCTFHSCRGLEAAYVVVIGLEKIEQVGEHVGVDAWRLAYVVLSRAIFDIGIAIRRRLNGRVLTFLDAAVPRIHARLQTKDATASSN